MTHKQAARPSADSGTELISYGHGSRHTMFKCALIGLCLAIVLIGSLITFVCLVDLDIKATLDSAFADDTNKTRSAKLMVSDENEVFEKLYETLRAKHEFGPIADTTIGRLRGHRQVIFGRDVDSFKGIPYAEPMVKNLRFRKTVPKEKWDGIRDAIQ